MTLFGRPVTEYLFTFALWAASIVYTVMAFGYPPEARALPGLVGIALVVLSTIDLVSLTHTRPGAWARWLNPAGLEGVRESHDASLGKQLTALGCVLALVVMLVLIGIVPATAVYVAGSLYFMGRRKPLTAVMIGLLVAAGIYATFEIGLRVELYKGLLFSGL